MYFAPGIDANPGVPGSNPKDIALAIEAGQTHQRNRTALGMIYFASDLLAAGRMSGDEAAGWLARDATDRAVIVALDVDAETVTVVPLTTSYGRVAEEAIVFDVDQLDSYAVMVSEHHDSDGPGYRFSRSFASPGDALEQHRAAMLSPIRNQEAADE
jgi:hypothetical protein